MAKQILLRITRRLSQLDQAKSNDMTERKEDPAVKKPGSSGKIPVNVVKIGQKGKKQPQKLVMSRDGIKCVKKNEDGWNKPPSSILAIAPSGSDKKTFTITTLHQQTFEVEDPAIYKRVCDLLKHMGAGMQSLEQSLSQLGVPASAILKSEPQSTKTRPSLRSKASETPANLLSLERLDPSHFVSMSDFELLHCVGKGSFGKVFQTRKISDGGIYAMKILKKKDLYDKNQIEHTLTERKILATINHSFMTRLHYAFQTDTKLYIVMDYVNGGEIFFHLRRFDPKFGEMRLSIICWIVHPLHFPNMLFPSLFVDSSPFLSSLLIQCPSLPEALAIFYCAEVVSAINHLHKRNIIYRDLKPENVLLDIDGHIVLTDFGLSKIGITSVGGEGRRDHSYVLRNSRISRSRNPPKHAAWKAVDWWSTGILFYEMLTGMPPFYSANKQEMFLNTLRAPLTIPDSVSEDARDFLKRSLNRHPEQRLGSGPGGGQEVLDHPLFKSINWEQLDARQLSPPFKPRFKNGIMDISNFDKEFLSLPLTDSPGPVLPEAVLARVNKEFSGWEYNKDVLGSAGKTGRPVPIYPGTAGAPSPKPAAEAPVKKPSSSKAPPAEGATKVRKSTSKPKESVE
ncbi:putative protein kinase [Blattamonas nauphoetae]|uniref:Non-specific serine/threonine protein kinase n=1 Tax=Blattamonas nauphoetae TaxID=2049346 RepID=A0ABQ9WSV2_9EUKA|nr:putative protein kinase [Blattamonas nauphoetae]